MKTPKIPRRIVAFELNENEYQLLNDVMRFYAVSAYTLGKNALLVRLYELAEQAEQIEMQVWSDANEK